MRKRANIADKTWTVQVHAVAVPDAHVRLRAAVGVLLAEIGDGPALETERAQGPVEAPRSAGAGQPGR